MQYLKNYYNLEFWNSLNLTWTKYFINFHHFENSLNYYPNNEIHLKVFEFPKNFLPSKHTLIVFKETIRTYPEVNKLDVNLVSARTLWRNLIHVADPT